MRANAREDEQRWAVLNSAMALLSSSKTTPDRMMLDQYKALVQSTQFLEHLRKTMPMSEPPLDMVLSMHECIFRRLNALEMLHKGGQRAVDEFMSSGLHGLEKRKANALQKAKRAEPQSSGGCGGGNAARRRARRSGGGQAFGNPAPSATQLLGQAFNAPRQQQQQQGVKCGKCSRFGHKTADCLSAGWSDAVVLVRSCKRNTVECYNISYTTCLIIVLLVFDIDHFQTSGLIYGD
jgi:hypothetical protein